MQDSMVILTAEDVQHIQFIKRTVDAIKYSLTQLSDQTKDHIKYEIEVFKNESEYLTDLLDTLSISTGDDSSVG